MMGRVETSERAASGSGEREDEDNSASNQPKDEQAKPKFQRPAPSIFSATELMAQKIPPVRWAIPGILPEGLSLLAGPPKIGKSWLALDLALAVTTGGQVLDRQVEQGQVLYLALEDTKRRLQGRLKILTSGNSASLDGLSLEIEWPPFDQGGLGYLDKWLGGHPAVRLVIVDTFERVRRKRRPNASIYGEDYTAIHEVKEIADKHQVSLLLIHHLRKMGASDPVEEVSGSTGLTGAADGILILKRERGQADAFLCATGRDIEEVELALNWDSNSARWRCKGNADDYRMSPERIEIQRVLIETEHPLSPKEVAEVLGKDYGAVKQLLFKMGRDGQIKATGSGTYTINNNDNLLEDSNSDNSSNQAIDGLSGLSVIEERVPEPVLVDA